MSSTLSPVGDYWKVYLPAAPGKTPGNLPTRAASDRPINLENDLSAFAPILSSTVVYRHKALHPANRVKAFLSTDTRSQFQHCSSGSECDPRSLSKDSEDLHAVSILKRLRAERINAADVCYFPAFAVEGRRFPNWLTRSVPQCPHLLNCAHTSLDILTFTARSAIPFKLPLHTTDPLPLPVELKPSLVATVTPPVLQPPFSRCGENIRLPATVREQADINEGRDAQHIPFRKQLFSESAILECKVGDLHPLNKIFCIRNLHGLAIGSLQYNSYSLNDPEAVADSPHLVAKLLYEKAFTSTDFICNMCTSPFQFGECAMISSERKILLWDTDSQQLTLGAHLGDSSFTQKGRYKKCIGEDFPQTLAYGSHPKHFIVGGSTLWNVDIRSEEASPLFPYPDNISHKTSSWRRVNTRMGLESNSFSFWKSFTAVERHPQRPYLLAAASAATNTLYVLDSRSTFEPLMQIPLPSSRLLGSRFRSLLWHHAGLSDTENNEDALCAFTWKYHSLRCANFQLNEATWWTLPGYKDDFSAAVTPCFVDSLFGTSALGANSALTGAADALTVSSDQPSKNADSLVCVDDEKNSLLSTTGADTQYFPVSSSSVGTATLPSSNHPHCPRETNNDIPLELSRVDIHPVVEFPIGKWSTASDHRYYRPIGPLIEGPKELWGLAFRLCDDSSIAKIFHGMASAVCLRLPVFLMNAVENSPTVPDDSSSTGISPLSQSECKSGKIIKAVLSMAIGSTVSGRLTCFPLSLSTENFTCSRKNMCLFTLDYHLRHCNTVSSSIPLPSILSSHQNNIAPAVPLASVPLTGGNHFGSILQQGGEIAEDTTHCQDFDHSAIGHAGDRYKKDCPEEIARILRMYANKIRVPVLKRLQESKDDFDERLSIPSGNVTQRSSLQTVNAPNYFDFSFSLLHRRVRCYEIYPAQEVLKFLFKDAFAVKAPISSEITSPKLSMSENGWIDLLDTFLKKSTPRDISQTISALSKAVKQNNLLYWHCSTTGLDYDNETSQLDSSFMPSNTYASDVSRNDYTQPMCSIPFFSAINPSMQPTPLCSCGKFLQSISTQNVDYSLPFLPASSSPVFAESQLDYSKPSQRNMEHQCSEADLRENIEYFEMHPLLSRIAQQTIQDSDSTDRIKYGMLPNTAAERILYCLLSAHTKLPLPRNSIHLFKTSPENIESHNQHAISAATSSTLSKISGCNYSSYCAARYLHCYVASSWLKNELISWDQKYRNSIFHDMRSQKSSHFPVLQCNLDSSDTACTYNALRKLMIGVQITDDIIGNLCRSWPPLMKSFPFNPFEKNQVNEEQITSHILIGANPVVAKGLKRVVDFDAEEVRRNKKRVKNQNLFRVLSAALQGRQTTQPGLPSNPLFSTQP